MCRSLARLIVRHSLSLVLGLLAFTPAAAATQPGQKQVLVIYSTRRDAQIVSIGERELPRILERELGSVDYYSEYIDQARFRDPQYQSAFRDFLRRKYQRVHFDAVITIQDAALALVSDERDALFAGSPVIFFVTERPSRPIENATGMISGFNFADTIDFAAQLQPDIQHVFVITGAEKADQEYGSLAREQLRRFESRLAITYLSGLPTRDLEARLAALPDRSIIYYLLVNKDGAGENVHPLEYLDRLIAVANAPVYCWVDSAMDHGIVGGSLKDQAVQLEALGRLAVRVLSGETASSIPVSSPNLNVKEVDWRQLRRWGIDEARVPAGTRILFKEPSAWDRYRVYIIGTVAVLLAQTMLIAGLLVQRRMRREAEGQVRRSQDELRASYGRIRDLGSRLLSAQDTERTRIARELHDDISQQMALLTIDLELLGNGDGTEQLAREALDRAHGVAKSVHDLSHRLHPAKLRLIGLVSALHALQRELSRGDTVIAFSHDNVPPSLPPDLTLSLFRIVQEALQNAVKYSKARTITVNLTGTDAGLHLSVADDGVGFDVPVAWGKGLGLISIGERLEAVAGRFEIRSTPGAGTRLDVTVPLHAERSGETVSTGRLPPPLPRADSA